ncbi:MAG: indole-3-glycerol phosphate synthase TrpC [Chloroflexi bacterium]|nr:indole-3-glycerol phosphate synthase TrpC [Chloroflexota bacterium]
MAGFVKTDTILDQILAQKELEIGFNLAEIARLAREAEPPRLFAAALRRDTVALIAEVKHASPSKGVLIENFDPVGLATTYALNGAAAISVLTDEKFFMGSLFDLKAVRAAVSVPVLRKDFIIDPYQVYEARAAGADATLLIVAALEDTQLADLHALVTELGMAALVEVHNEAELERALKIGATLIGVNNRDLKTFREDLGTTGRVAQRLPENVTLVAESAIRGVADVRKMAELGAHAVLVGEGLVKAANIAEQVRLFSSQAREAQRD